MRRLFHISSQDGVPRRKGSYVSHEPPKHRKIDQTRQRLHFKYSSLVAGNAVRLLKIHRGHRDDPLSGTLFEIDPRRSEEYQWIAISYAWGGDEMNHQVCVNNKTLRTTESCYEVLLNMRRRHEDVVIWIDAICINQRDPAEKGHQVQRMGAIYSEAMSVVVWLGEVDCAELHTACKFLKAIDRRLEDGRLTTQSTVHDFLASTRTTVHSEEWGCVEDLFASPWVKRLWVVQEVVLARHVIFRCGAYRLSWDAAGFVCAMLRGGIADNVPGPPSRRRHHADFDHLIDLREDASRTIKKGIPQALSTVAYSCRRRMASNPRDYVYGILGLAGDDRRADLPALNIDYAQSVERTYIQATRWTIRRERSLLILSLIPPFLEEPNGLPSWVTDYELEVGTLSLGVTGGNLYHAHDHTYARIMVDVDDEQNESILQLEGLIMDEINQQTPVCDTYWSNDGSPGRRHLIEWCGEALDIYERTAAVKEEWFWRTLLGDSLSNEDRMVQAVSKEEVLEGKKLFNRFFMDNPRSRKMAIDDLLTEMSQHQGLSAKETSLLRRFILTISDIAYFRRFAVLGSRNLALVPRRSLPGDKICIIPGGCVPYIIRPTPSEGPDCYEFIGEAYVHGIMQGEGVRMGKKMRPINLV